MKHEEFMTAVTLDSTQTINLKSMLKYINQYAANRTPDVADEETFVSAPKVSFVNMERLEGHELMMCRALDI